MFLTSKIVTHFVANYGVANINEQLLAGKCFLTSKIVTHFVANYGVGNINEQLLSGKCFLTSKIVTHFVANYVVSNSLSLSCNYINTGFKFKNRC